MQSNGADPFGIFNAISDNLDEGYITHPSYNTENKFDAFDVGIVILDQMDGQEVGEVVPALEIQWGQEFEVGKIITTLGYVDEDMWETKGVFKEIEGPRQKVVIRQGDIPKGNSGGPWFYNGKCKVVGSTVSGDSESEVDELASLFYESEDTTFSVIKNFLTLQEMRISNKRKKAQK